MMEEDIKIKVNPLHNGNYYLDINFERISLENAPKVFNEFARGLDKSLQVMISSEKVAEKGMLQAAGFVCKRKCYEVEAQQQDYIGGIGESEIVYSYADEDIYVQCCERMMDRYIMTHQNINPWTGRKERFFAELPECVAYSCADGKVAGFAFVEDAEIAYVYGENIQEFRMFAQALITEMFRKYEVITFEADDCDEFAMELKSMFTNQDEESFDTYIRHKYE